MDDQNKLPHSIIGALLSWALTALVWCGTHIGVICGLLAGIASLYSIRASRETIKYRRKQVEQLTSSHIQEPDTDL